MRDEDKSKDELITELQTLRAKLAVQNHLAHIDDEKFWSILNAMHDSMVILDAQGRVILMNRHLAESIYLTPGEAIGKTIYELLPQEIATKRMSQYATALDKRELVQFEDERDGKYFHHTVYPVLGVEGQNDYLIIFVQNITAQLEVRQTHAQAQRYLDATAAMLVSLNREGEIVLINQATCQLLGYEKEELLGKNWFDTCVPSWLRPDIKESFKVIINGDIESLAYYENPVLTKSGEERLIAWQNSLLLRDENGEIEGTLSSGIDITERKLAENALHASEAKVRAILEALPDLMFRLARDGTHLEFYAPNLRQLLIQPDDFLGKRVQDVLPSKTAQLYADAIERTLEQRSIQVFEYSLDFDERSTVHYEARMVVADENEVLVIVRDITEYKEIEAQRIELLINRERIQLLETVISDLSHDIKTPLTNMKTSLYLLEKQSDADKKQRHMDNLDTHIQHLDKLIDNILVMSRLDNGPELTFVPVDLNLLVEYISAEYQELANEKGITLTLELKANLPYFMGNEEKFQQVIVKLLENALNYTSAGDKILLRSNIKDSQIIFEIHDTGLGISESDLPHIFERFYRADKSRNTSKGGTGLGLAIVKKIVELHRGSVEVESTIEEGSVFRICLPARPQHVQ